MVAERFEPAAALTGSASCQGSRSRATRYDLVPNVMPDGGPARYVQLKGTDMRIGFITPILRHFCMTCNRMRLMGLYICV